MVESNDSTFSALASSTRRDILARFTGDYRLRLTQRLTRRLTKWPVTGIDWARKVI
jgi:hypothetical protein